MSENEEDSDAEYERQYEESKQHIPVIQEMLEFIIRVLQMFFTRLLA